MNQPLSLIKKNQGMSFIEIVVAIGIASIIMLSIPAMMQILNQNSSQLAVGVTKTEIITKIRLNAINLNAVEASAKLTQTLGSAGITPDVGTPNTNAHPDMLAKCMPTVTGVSGCDKTSMDDVRGFKFYLAGGNSLDPLNSIAGEDIYYSSRGAKCTSAQAANAVECPIKTSVWAEPFCNDFKTTCSKAIALTIRYRLEIRSDYNGPVLFAPQEGEVYVTLSKGIQLSRVLSQSDTPIQLNSNGIYSVQKYYGYADQVAQPSGLRFEAILGNPTGLVSMKLQYRSITGVDANGFLDNEIPTGFNAGAPSVWYDVEDPLSAGTPWVVQLAGAKSNQIINFGTQTSATTTNNTNKAFRIGATTAESAALQQKYRWTVNASNQIVAPTFLTGFYQFRVVATDSTNTQIDSMNYVTVRIVPRPQYLYPTNPSTDLFRNCSSGQTSVTYQIGIADDESLGAQTLTLNTVPATFTAITGRSGYISIPFDLSQEIGASTKSFSYYSTAKNKFSGLSVNGMTIPTVADSSFSVTLKEKPVAFQTLSSNPSKIRIGTSGTAGATIETGSCCNETPTIQWQYLSVPEAGAALLSGNATSAVTCDTYSGTNTRLCYSTVQATGIKESPSGSNSNDISARFTFTGTTNACTGGTTTQSYNNNTNIPVVKIPGIQFYLSESLWLNLPGNPISSAAIKSFVPTVYVRADFQPDEPVSVSVHKSTDNSLVCTVNFDAGTGTNPIDKSCTIPAGYSGDLTLQRVTPNVMIDTDTPGNSFRAKLVTGKLSHRTCQANLQSVPEFANYTVPSNQPMYNSPWGFTTDAGGNVIQDAKNDTGLWPASSVKNFRCYDQWNGTLGTSNYSNSDLLTINGIGTNLDINIQDIYNVHRYNTEIKAVGLPNTHVTIGSSYPASSKARYQTYVFPDNPNLDFDPKNAPYLFAIYHQSGFPGYATWQFSNPTTGGTSTTPPKTWTDYTPQLCSGASALSTIRLYGIKTVGHSTAETVMKATNNIYTSSPTGYYSYSFMCSFGRWNPFSKANTSWSN